MTAGIAVPITADTSFLVTPNAQVSSFIGADRRLLAQVTGRAFRNDLRTGHDNVHYHSLLELASGERFAQLSREMSRLAKRNALDVVAIKACVSSITRVFQRCHILPYPAADNIYNS
jgi:hypothetical protein